jgi:nucleoside-diphosphate-sugar epimerase
MSKVVITGAKGVVGTVLSQGLQKSQMTLLDLPEHDVRSITDLEKVFPGHEAVIHLAWDIKSDNYLADTMNPDNLLMAYNVYKSALDNGIKRVIVSSSIHADSYDLKGVSLISPYRLPEPQNPYGAGKVYMEALGRYFSHKGLEVVCLRLGSVRKENRPSDSPGGEARFLKHNDLISLIEKCLISEAVPDNYAIINAVSNNAGRIHDIINPFGWQPE